MKIIRGLANLAKQQKGCIATIGNFDGVHLGHQYVLGELAEKGANLNLPSTLITFEPQPQEYFLQHKSPGRLSRFREKIRALSRLALDQVLVLSFNARLAKQEPSDFIRQVLVKGLGVKHLVVGEDFHFGKNRSGNFKLLQQSGQKYGFTVASMHNFKIDNERVSSTKIRQALHQGNLDLAKKLLGRPYRICGRIAHGHKRGRDIGFPTANIHIQRKVAPMTGVFVVEMFGIAGEPVSGVANLGIRPTVHGTKTILEVHLFDFNFDIYGKYVSVDFLAKIREEKKFDSFSLLQNQIKQDVQSAKEILRS